jgi:hypothetical protein
VLPVGAWSTVAPHGVALDEHVVRALLPAARPEEEAVGVAVHLAATDRHTAGALDEDPSHGLAVALRLAIDVGERVRRSPTRDRDALDDEGPRHLLVRVAVTVTDDEDASRLVPFVGEVGLRARGRAGPVEHGELAPRAWYPAQANRLGLGPLPAQHDLLPVGLGPVVDADGVTAPQGLRRDLGQRLVGTTRADLVVGAGADVLTDDGRERGSTAPTASGGVLPAGAASTVGERAVACDEGEWEQGQAEVRSNHESFLVTP